MRIEADPIVVSKESALPAVQLPTINVAVDGRAKTKTALEKTRRIYFGMSVQHFAMSEFLVRGYNVAIPEVDVGDDVIVIKDEIGILTRVQVKSTNIEETKNKKGQTYFKTGVNIRWDQLYADLQTELFYFIPFRFERKWQTHLIISRKTLEKLHGKFLEKTASRKRSSSRPKQTTINFTMNSDFKEIRSWKNTSFDEFREDWSKWPPKL